MVKFAWTFALLALIVGVVLPALPAEGQVMEIHKTGHATGIDRDNQAGVTIVGRFATPAGFFTDPFRCPSSVTLFAVIQDDVGNDVNHPFDLLPALPLPNSFFAIPATVCIYKSAVGSLPIVTLKVGRVSGGGGGADTGQAGVFNFILTVRQATYGPDGPDGCPIATLRTNFALVGIPFPPTQGAIEFDATNEWKCFGPNNRYLKTP